MAGVTHAPASGPGEQVYTDEEHRALRLWIALARSTSSFTKVVASRVSAYGLTLPQFGVLEALYHLGPLPLGELAEKLLVTGGNVTYVMDRLEDQGLVVRTRCEEDRRVVRAELTPEGHRLVERVFPGHAAFITELAGILDPAEQETLRSLLKKLGKGVGGRGELPGS